MDVLISRSTGMCESDEAAILDLPVLVQDAVSAASHAALEYHLLVAVGIEA